MHVFLVVAYFLLEFMLLPLAMSTIWLGRLAFRTATRRRRLKQTPSISLRKTCRVLSIV